MADIPSVADFDYQLPPDRIAQHPVEPRDAARLLVALGQQPLLDRQVRDLPALLAPGDLLVLNRTRVIPARLEATKASGGRIEVLLVHPVDPSSRRWRCLIRGKVRVGTELLISDHQARVVAIDDDGHRDVEFSADCDVLALADQVGHMPLPPYIDRADTAADRERYQTVFGDSPGSVAAPTASLHLTQSLLDQLEERGIRRAMVDLAVGPGTFKPVQADRIEDHRMHAEHCECPPETIAAIAQTRAAGGRVIAVGTTVVRTLETAAAASPHAGELAPYAGWTSIFLHPPKRMQVVDGLLTNFHLPRSTLLMLVACLTGVERLHELYAHAIKQEYRFYSYGDAMLLLP